MRKWVIALVVGLALGFAVGYLATHTLVYTPTTTHSARSNCITLTASATTFAQASSSKRSATSIESRVTEIPESSVSRTPPSPILLIASKYDDYVLKLVSNANRSVYVMMFVVKYYPNNPKNPVDSLLNALCRDVSRGVRVRVLLDETSYREYRNAVTYLQHCNVEVRIWHECGSLWRLHAKVVIVDGKYVVIGSHNWTYSALAHNIEVSVSIRSSSIASKLIKLFNELWNSGCSFAPR